METQPENHLPTQLQVKMPELGKLTGKVQAGNLCPVCGQGILDYDGLLTLRCPKCDFAEGGCFT